jgi:hypothetical protein
LTYKEYLENLVKARTYEPHDESGFRELEIEFSEKFPGNYIIKFEARSNLLWTHSNNTVYFNLTFNSIEDQTEWLLRYG